MSFRKPNSKKANSFLEGSAKDNTRTLSIYGVEDTLIKELEEFSKEAGVSLSKIVRIFLDEGVKKEKQEPFIIPMIKRFK